MWIKLFCIHNLQTFIFVKDLLLKVHFLIMPQTFNCICIAYIIPNHQITQLSPISAAPAALNSLPFGALFSSSTSWPSVPVQCTGRLVFVFFRRLWLPVVPQRTFTGAWWPFQEQWQSLHFTSVFHWSFYSCWSKQCLYSVVWWRDIWLISYWRTTIHWSDRYWRSRIDWTSTSASLYSRSLTWMRRIRYWSVICGWTL